MQDHQVGLIDRPGGLASPMKGLSASGVSLVAVGAPRKCTDRACAHGPKTTRGRERLVVARGACCHLGLALGRTSRRRRK